jgi:hypothetical protein
MVFKELKQLQQSFYQMQVVLANIESTADASGTGNPYKNYDSAVFELGKKYEGMSDWGNFQARTIVDVRSSFIIGNGIQVVERDPVTRKTIREKSGKFKKEVDFIESLITSNDIDEEMAQEFAKEAELEGRVLFKLVPNEKTKNIDLRHMSYTTYKYKVKAADEDYKVYDSVTYRIPGASEDKKLEKGEFVYKKFAGRTDKVNDLLPKTATILRQIEDLDKAMKDLRSINNLFASPTPHFDCEDSTIAEDLYNKMVAINWKIGKFIVTTKTTFNMVGVDAAGIEALIKEITNIVKIISGVTGIPVHFLGLPDLMSNRSTSTDMFEMIIASTNRERKTWVGCYEEIFDRAMEMANNKFKTNLKLGTVSCDIPQITAAKLKELVEVWLPLFNSNVIDLDYMLSMIPDADPERIKKAALEEAKQTLAILKAQEQNQPPQPQPNE